MKNDTLTSIQEIISNHGASGVLPQNLSNQLLRDLIEYFPLEHYKKSQKTSRQRDLAAVILCVTAILRQIGKNINVESDLAALKELAEIYLINLRLEALARKRGFKISPEPSIEDILLIDRKFTIPKKYLED